MHGDATCTIMASASIKRSHEGAATWTCCLLKLLRVCNKSVNHCSEQYTDQVHLHRGMSLAWQIDALCMSGVVLLPDVCA